MPGVICTALWRANHGAGGGERGAVGGGGEERRTSGSGGSGAKASRQGSSKAWVGSAIPQPLHPPAPGAQRRAGKAPALPQTPRPGPRFGPNHTLHGGRLKGTLNNLILWLLGSEMPTLRKMLCTMNLDVFQHSCLLGNFLGTFLGTSQLPCGENTFFEGLLRSILQP